MTYARPFFPFGARRRRAEPQIRDIRIHCKCQGHEVLMMRVDYRPRRKNSVEQARLQCPFCAESRKIRRVPTFFFGFRIEIS